MEHLDAAATDALTQALVFLAATCPVIPALRRAGVSAVMGFLLIGVAMGPHVLGRLAESWAWLSPVRVARKRRNAAAGRVRRDLFAVRDRA